MRKIYFILSILALLSLSCTLKAQRKIALLIAGDHTKSPQVSPNQVIYPWNDTFGSSLDWEEFWNDSYLWYETFKYSFNEGGYGYNSVYFLFSDGSFYPASTYNVRYNKTGTEIFGKASLEKVQYVLNHLANDLTVDDFLFIWTMGHGGFCNNENDHIMYLSDNNGVTEYITATEFSNLVNSINAGKKVIFMQQPSSAGFDKFNSADNTIFYSSCLANQASYRANDTPFLENEIWITNMIPKKYYHGEFNFHTYSAIKGESPDYATIYGFYPFSDADLNNDNIVSIFEAREGWESIHANQNDTSYFSDLSGIAATTTLKYPTIIPDNVTSNLTLSGTIGITHPVHILDGCTLTITNKSIVYLDYAGELIVDQGGSLVLGDSVTFTAFDIAGTVKRIVINGGFEVGIKPVFELFKNNPSENVLHIFINNPNLEVLFKSGSFNEVLLEAYNIHNIFDSCSFRPGNVIGNNGDYNFLNCWIAGEVHLFNKKNERFVDVDSCKFYGFYNGTALRIENYSHVRISNTLFDQSTYGYPAYEVAIFLANSGTRIGMINNCEIFNNYDGVVAYNSNVRIIDNVVAYNGIGLKCLNRSNVALYNPDATTVSQIIQNNHTGAIYSTWESFPYYMKYNVLKKSPLSEYLITCSPAPIAKDYDVRDNSWYPSDPEPHLFPQGKFIWIPVWQPNPGLKSSDIAESMYFSALGLIESEDFNQAKAVLMQLVNGYPYSSFSQAALRDLFEIEDFCGSDFFALRNYYQSDSVIQNNASLLKRAGFFANQCEIKLKNWPAAINWFEDVIQNPESFEDSLFAIIDLGYTYLLMADSGYKSTYTGRLPEYKPVSREQFSKNRDYLLSLIPNDRSNSIIQANLSLLKYGELLQNVPNPFSSSTQIWFKIEERSFVMIHVFDYTGKRVKTLNRGMLEKGTHSVDFSAYDARLATGLYFYSLEINGQISDSKKMTILK